MRAQNSRQLRIMITGLVCCVASWQAGMARAGLVAVDWRGDYVSKSVQLAGHNPLFANSSNKYGDPDTNGVYTGRLVSNSTQYNPSLADGYDTAARSAVFYGGHAVEWASASGNTGLTNLSIDNQGTTDALQLEIKADANLKGYAALFYWQQPDFLNGLNNKVVDLSETNFTLQTTQVNVPSTNPDQLRWVIRNGTNDFYISSLSNSIQNNYGYTSAASSLTWQKYTPLTGLSGIHWSSGANAVGPLNNITAFGFYLDYGLVPHGMDMKITQFLVTAKGNDKPGHVPEPGFALVGLFGAAFCTVRHLKARRTRKSGASVETADVPMSDLPAEQSTLIDC